MSRTAGVLALLAAVAALTWLSVQQRRGESEPQRAARIMASQATAASAEEIEAIRLPLRAALRASERAVARIALERLAPDDPLVSKVGGAPYLPAGESLPQTPRGVDMVLLAQVNFAEVPPMPGYPRQGVFQIFISPELDDLYGYEFVDGTRSPQPPAEQRLYRTRYWPAPLQEREALQMLAVPDTRGGTPHAPHQPRRMRFALAREPITPLDVDFEARVGVEPYAFVEAAARRLDRDLMQLSQDVFDAGAGHKLGGYPYFTQTDPRAPGTPLRLLLQLDSDDEILWGDAGVGNVFIDPDDLARADFSRVLYTWDNH